MENDGVRQGDIHTQRVLQTPVTVEHIAVEEIRRAISPKPQLPLKQKKI
jgi:hypothetical protein